MYKKYTIRKIIEHGDSIGVTILPDAGFRLGDYVKVFLENGCLIVEKVQDNVRD